MADQTVTQLVIDADGATSGANQFSSAMDSVEAAAQKTLGTLSDLNGGLGDTLSAFSSLGAGILSGGVIAAMTGIIDYVVQANKALSDMQVTAKQVGLSLADFQGVQFGGQIAGLSTDQINAGLEKSASLLNDASRNSNSLSKELDANGISVKNANGQLITQNQLLGIAAALISKAQNPGDAAAIAQMLGFTKEWIPLLEQGAGAMGNLTEQAQAAGAVIDDETVQRAADFDTQWRKSSVEFSTYMKAALSELLPYLDDLIERASKFVKSIDADKVQQAANDQLDVLSEATGLPTHDQSLAIGITPDALQAIDNIKDASTLWSAIATVFNGVSIKVTQTPFVASQDPMASSAYPKSGPADFAAVQRAADAAADAQQDAADGFSKVADRASQANDILDRAINTLSKHTDQTAADADAVGLGAGALAGMRAEATLLSAALANGTTVTPQLAAKFKDLADDAADAADDLAKLQVAANIKFTSQTAFLSPQDVQIATQLKSIYGNDIPAALNSTEAAQLRVVNAQKSINDAAGNFATTFVQGILSGKSAVDSLASSLSTVGSSLTAIGTKSLSSSLTTALGGGGLSFDPASIGVGAIGIGASLIGSLLGQDSASQQALQQAQQQWAAMTDQVNKFSLAAKGVDLGPLTNQLTSLFSSFQQIQTEALKANDYSGAASAANTFNQGVSQVVSSFVDATTTLTPLQQSIKGVNDEATGLKSTLDEIGSYDLDGMIDAAAQAQIAALVAQFSTGVTTGLTSRLNTAQGNDYLNSAQDVLTQHQQDLSDAAELGNPASLMAQISATFAAEAQKVVNDAGLVGDQFNSFIQLFPQFAGVVTQSAAAIQAVNDNFAALTKTIDSYLDSLQLGSNSILSPQDQLNAAQSQFNAQLTLAQQGNTDAIGSITQYASTLLDQAKGYYASSQGYTDVYNAVTNALKGLTTMPTPGLAMGGIVGGYASGGMIGNGSFGVDSVMARYAGGGSVALAGGEFVMPAAQTQAHLPLLEAMRNGGGASNDNSGFAALGQQFANVMAAACSAEISAINTQTDALRSEIRGLRTALEALKPKAPRPNAKAA